MMEELWTRKREMVDKYEHDVADYERMWDIMGTTCLIGFRTPHIVVITRGIGTRTWCNGDGKLTRTQNSLKSQFLMMISRIPSHLCHACPQLYHHRSTQSYLIALYLSMPWSRANSEYCIHRVQHTPNTAYTEHSLHRVQHTLSTAYAAYCIIPRSTVSRSQPVSHLSADHVVFNSLHWHNYELTNE